MDAMHASDNDRKDNPRLQRAGAILWPSFFAAGVATTVCFALFDPLVLRDVGLPSIAASRELIYTLGFFAFWCSTAAASLFTALLLRPPRSTRG
jgi:hypothetical protein